MIMFAASLWALDALIRTQLTFTMPAASIVFYEHLLGLVILSPFLLKVFKKFKTISLHDWLLLLLLSLVSSVGATLMFTESLARSFAEYDFATPILLQKLQPVFVILLASLFLKEKLTLRFLLLAVIALIGSYMISFGAEGVTMQFSGKESVVMLAVGAAAAWGAGTIFSKKILKRFSFTEATSLRFLLAVPVSLIAAHLLNASYPVASLTSDQLLRFLLIAVSTGAVALLIYYKGLKNTQAKVSTIAELTFPVVSVLIAVSALNPYGEPQKLMLANTFGIIILLISIILISFDYADQIKLEDSKS